METVLSNFMIFTENNILKIICTLFLASQAWSLN